VRHGVCSSGSREPHPSFTLDKERGLPVCGSLCMKIWLACLLSAALLAGSSSLSLGQSWPSWADELFDRRRSEFPPSGERRAPRALESKALDVRDGGPRPTIEAEAPPIVPFAHAFQTDSIVIDVGKRKLYYVLPEHRAFQYSIGVGREGFGWTGTETISRKQEWPDWHPPAEMRERDPNLPEKMTGGLKNPLGAVALYLGTTLYRIHGTNDAASIGRADSSGCFRLLNAQVLHLASLTKIGTPVTVIDNLSAAQQVSEGPARPRPAPVTPPDASVQEREVSSSPMTSARARPPDTPDYRTLRDLTLKER
jgi:lipoprotein-anchoring transpeptidase ErfK/SrfK